MRFFGGDVVHFRPSGNADEFHIYSVADSPLRAGEIVEMATCPGDILRQMADELESHWRAQSVAAPGPTHNLEIPSDARLTFRTRPAQFRVMTVNI